MSENMATKLFKYCYMVIRALFDLIKRSLFQRSQKQQEAEEYTDSPATERRDLQPQPQPGPSSDVLQSGLGSSYSSGEGSVNNKFDVFISHRGPDTKRSMARAIYDLLQERGVEAFLDTEELQSGERFPEAIEKAIACSKVDVCILSSGFAESEWCLKELLMMLHKYDRGTSTLIPIFYDVKPAEVKSVKGAFGQGFKNLQSKDTNSSEDIDQWRRALGKIGEISGYEGKGERCKIIVNKICELLHVGFVATPREVLGIKEQVDSILCDIMKCRENGLSVTSVEISGIGGVGKTTFAKELYNKICPNFERFCFIEDVNGLVEKHGINKVHKQLLKKLFQHDSSSFTMNERTQLMKRLHNAEILVVLDNIHTKIPLSDVFIEDVVSLNPKSVIIVTSREEGVLKHDSRVKTYCEKLISLKINKLDFDTSKQIFCHYAFGRIDNVENEFNELIEKMVRKCDGIPLALTLLGQQVYKKDIISCKELWSSMKDCLHSDLKEQLKLSYDNLTSKLEKCLFLDVATIFHGEKEDLLVELRRQSDDEDGELQVKYALGVLKRNLLISVSCGVLQMHDVLVDLGRSIVKDENLCPGHRSRVWYPSDVRRILSYDLGTKKVKALSLVSEGSGILDEDQCPWSADVFSKLSSLEILILHGHCIEGDFSKLSKRLLWLRWIDFPYEQIPLNLYIKHLRVLHVSGENLIQLWEHPPQDAPSKLRELIFPHCIKLERLPELIGRLRHLSSINMDECKSLKFIPESFGQLQGLKEFKLQGCHALEGLPESFGNLRSLSSLRMKGCRTLKQLPETFGKLRSLRFLEIEGCGALKQLPETFGELRSLDTLEMMKCDAMVSLPESFGQLRSLTGLMMMKCNAMVSLPESFGELRNLLRLTMLKCNAMVSLPESFGELRRLTFLHMEKCDAMVSLPESFEKLLQLEQLDIIACNGLERPPQSLECLTSLSRLVVSGCRKIRFSPEQFQWLQPMGKRLWSLSTYLCDGIEVADFCCERTNNTLVGSNWPLKSVRVHQRMRMRNMFRCRPSKNNNNNTGASGASDLLFIGVHFIESARDMTFPYKITLLSLRGFCNLRELPELAGNWYMKTLILCHCHNLQKLPDRLPCLESLILEWCCNLQELPDAIGNSPNLRYLKVISCLALKGFPSSLRNLSCLKELIVQHCWMVEVINTQGLFSLTRLTVSNCFNLQSIVGISDLGELQTLEIQECMNLKSIVGLSNICKLETLVIQGCISLRHMPLPVGGFASFNSLSDLRIARCYQFRFSEDPGERLPREFRGYLLWDDSNLIDREKGAEGLNVKTSPVFFATVKERLRHVLLSSSGSPDKPFSFFIHEPEFPGFTHIPSLPFIPHAAVTCFVSSVYTDDFSDHIPLPITDFKLFCKYFETEGSEKNFRRFDFGEEIHVAVHGCTKLIFDQDVKRGNFPLSFRVKKDRLHTDGWPYPSYREERWPYVSYRASAEEESEEWAYPTYGASAEEEWAYPSYEASVKEGCIIFLNGGGREQSELLTSEIFEIFSSELIKQRLMSQAWTQLPSQLRIHDFSALDIAGCQITKISRHCNTCIMEEEIGLTWKRRRCIFMDDHSLLLHQPKNRKHSFLAYPGVDCDLEAAVANLYEMSISILQKGVVVHSRKLQQISPKTEEEIPSPLNTLLQGIGFHFTLETMHTFRPLMLWERKHKGLHIEFGND